MTAPNDYRRLPGIGYTYISRCSLWLGKDHLLAAETTFFTETYRRFYFHDLQAVVIQENRARRDWTIILGVIAGLVAALFGLILLASGLNPAAWTLFALLEAPLLLGLLFNGLRGPTCRCRLQTAVQAVELPSLRRLRKAERVIATLRPLIEQAQGVVTADMLRSLTATQAAPAVSTSSAVPVPEPAPEPAAEPGSEPGPDLINNLLNK